MWPHSTSKKSRHYVSFVCARYQRLGSTNCPASRIGAAQLERFVVERIKAIGADPPLVEETIRAAKREAEARQPELESEIHRLVNERRRLETERANVIGVISENGTRSPGLTQKVGEVEIELDRLTKRLEEARAELATLNDGVIDENDLKAALASFTQIWDALVTEERRRLLALLIEQITFNGVNGEVEVRFRACGIRSLATERAAEEQKETS